MSDPRAGMVEEGAARANEPAAPTEAESRQRELSPAAKRALAEAEERRRAQAAEPKPETEVGGQDGPDPIRYGDWEKNGIASDF